MTIGWKHEVFLNPQTRTRQELPEQEVGENGGDVGRIALCVHDPECASKQEFHASYQGSDVWCGDNGNAVCCKKTGYVSQKSDRAFDVFDRFHGKHQIKSSDAQGVGK